MKKAIIVVLVVIAVLFFVWIGTIISNENDQGVYDRARQEVERTPETAEYSYTPENFPYISFIVPAEYEISYEELDLVNSYSATWRATLYNQKDRTYISVTYEAIYNIKDGNWQNSFNEVLGNDGVYYDDYTLPQPVSETEGYTIHQMVEKDSFLVLPKNWDEVIGIVSVAYSHFYIADYGIENNRFVGATFDTDNGDEETAKKIAESVTPSTLTYEEYEKLLQEAKE